jgi:dTDP-4-dehydrorhamnose reductase
MRILLTGPTGQVGSALAQELVPLGELVTAGRERLDLAKPDSILECVRAVGPDVIVNAAAYTAVDRAESEEVLAMAVNRDGPAVVAKAAAECDALLLHFSTDYVFDGQKSSPYVEADFTGPLNVYGHSKLAGEKAVQASGCRHLILRTSWVYATIGNNFLLTMLRLARSGKPLRVVDDQFGAPTSNLMIATAVGKLIPLVMANNSLSGTYHLSAAGKTSWYGFAEAIFETTGTKANLTAVRSKEYQSPARRPANSLLDTSKLARQFSVRLPHWADGLREVIARL